MESFGDKARAFGFALGLHVLFLLALLVGLWWTQATRPVTMPGPVIEATLVGPTAAPKPQAGKREPARPPKPKAPPRPEPKPEPKPEPAPPKPATPTPSEVQRQDLVEREKVAALAREQAEQARREEEARVRQQQVELEQEQEKERKLRAEKEKQLAEIREARAAAERKLKLEKERLAQLEDRNRQPAERAAAQPAAEHEAAQAQTGAGGADNDLTARYSAAIQAVVTQNWNRPESAQAGLRCTLDITQIPGGEVIAAVVSTPCNADPATRRSIEQAVMRAAPLPYQGYEKVFQRRIKFTFRYDG
ncbi:cell envelope integrity protein TolA [Dokdonella sp.]|uniref:cell envelope integrity protein TolA n=1 Tax=Dokdonella sp. TaxID=2291710 RepID=UPI0031BE0C43|nr:cell envelope integrity protein TolA [Dokdonella sp.]